MNVYVGQFDSFWKLSMQEWVDLCRGGVDGHGYDLTPYRRLRHQPRFIIRGDDRRRYSSIRIDVLYVEPLDWYPEDFAEHLANIARRR